MATNSKIAVKMVQKCIIIFNMSDACMCIDESMIGQMSWMLFWCALQFTHIEDSSNEFLVLLLILLTCIPRYNNKNNTSKPRVHERLNMYTRTHSERASERERDTLTDRPKFYIDDNYKGTHTHAYNETCGTRTHIAKQELFIIIIRCCCCCCCWYIYIYINTYTRYFFFSPLSVLCVFRS